jgi:hypothetical protein
MKVDAEIMRRRSMLSVTYREVGERRYLWHNKKQRSSASCNYDCIRRHYITAGSCGEIACEHEDSGPAWAFGKRIQQERGTARQASFGRVQCDQKKEVKVELELRLNMEDVANPAKEPLRSLQLTVLLTRRNTPSSKSTTSHTKEHTKHH